MTKSNRTKLVQARVTPELHEAVKALAGRYDASICQIVRWALAEYIEAGGFREKARGGINETR